jgi:RimJ/RimL family protein N-acetyltransferase
MAVTQVSLTPLTAELAADIYNGRRHATWADDFPTDADVMLAGLVCRRIAAGIDFENATAEQPWLSLFLVIADDLLVGGCGFKAGPDSEQRIEIGYGIAESHQNRGIATAAVQLLINLATPLGLTVVAETEADNLASQRVLMNSGFTRWQRDDEEHIWWLRSAQ